MLGGVKTQQKKNNTVTQSSSSEPSSSAESKSRSATAANNSAKPANTSNTLTAQQKEAKKQCELDKYGKYSNGVCRCPDDPSSRFSELTDWSVDTKGRCRPKEQRDCIKKNGKWSHLGDCIVPSAANTTSSSTNSSTRTTQNTNAKKTTTTRAICEHNGLDFDETTKQCMPTENQCRRACGSPVRENGECACPDTIEYCARTGQGYNGGKKCVMYGADDDMYYMAEQQAFETSMLTDKIVTYSTPHCDDDRLVCAFPLREETSNTDAVNVCCQIYASGRTPTCVAHSKTTKKPKADWPEFSVSQCK